MNRGSISQVEQKLLKTSEKYYRSGLSKAEAGDLSRAANDLKKALQYDKYHENARNVLGLVEFHRGELGEAMKQWSISEYYNKNQNRATYYLHEIKTEPQLLTNMNESIHLFNEAMELLKRNSNDFAIARLRKAVHLNPQYVKAQLVLSLCYIENRHFKTALRVLDQVAKVDPLNPDAMRYRLYIARQLQEGTEDASVRDIQDLSQDLYVQQALAEPDKEEIFKETRKKRKAVFNMSESLLQLLLFFAGVFCCVGFMKTLWFPDQIRELEDQVTQLSLSQMQLREEKEELKQEIQQAGDLFQEISQSQTSVGAGIKADIDELLSRWEMQNYEP